MVSALDSRSGGRWFQPGHYRRAVFSLSLFTQVYKKWEPAIIMLGGKLVMD